MVYLLHERVSTKMLYNSFVHITYLMRHSFIFRRGRGVVGLASIYFVLKHSNTYPCNNNLSWEASFYKSDRVCSYGLYSSEIVITSIHIDLSCISYIFGEKWSLQLYKLLDSYNYKKEISKDCMLNIWI